MDNRELIDVLERGHTVAYKKEQLDKVIGKIDEERNIEFSHYLTDKFTTALRTVPVAEILKKWDSLPESEKVLLTKKVIDKVLNIIISDIDYNRVTLYAADGSVLKDIDPEPLALFKEDIKAPEIEIGAISSGQMGVVPTRHLNINFKFPMYKMSDCFLMDLRHELAHIIDIFIPAISPLPPETRMVALRNYIQPKDGNEYYENNPVEINAQTCRSEYAAEIRKALKDIDSGKIIALPDHVRLSARQSAMLQILNDTHNKAKNNIEQNRGLLPKSLYEGTVNRDDFIDDIILELEKKQKKLMDLMYTYEGDSYDAWKYKVSSEYLPSIIISSPANHNSSEPNNTQQNPENKVSLEQISNFKREGEKN